MKATFGKVDARYDLLLANLSEFEIEGFVGRLTDAAYQVALQQGFRGSFLDLELELWHTLDNVVKQNRSLPLNNVLARLADAEKRVAASG